MSNFKTFGARLRGKGGGVMRGPSQMSRIKAGATPRLSFRVKQMSKPRISYTAQRRSRM